MTRPNRIWEPSGTDRILGISTMVLCAGLFVATFGFPVVDWDPLGMAFWPRVVIAILFALSAFFIVKGRVIASPPAKVVLKAFIIPLGGIAYALFLKWFGYVATTVFVMCLFTVILLPPSRYRFGLAAMIAFLGTGLAYGIFELLLQVYLPVGWFFQP